MTGYVPHEKDIAQFKRIGRDGAMFFLAWIDDAYPQLSRTLKQYEALPDRLAEQIEQAALEDFQISGRVEIEQEIPADVKEAARVALSEALRDPRVGFAIKACMIGGAYDAFTAAIEQTIAAERERCAQVADAAKEANSDMASDYVSGRANMAEAVAAAIRRGDA